MEFILSFVAMLSKAVKNDCLNLLGPYIREYKEPNLLD